MSRKTRKSVPAAQRAKEKPQPAPVAAEPTPSVADELAAHEWDFFFLPDEEPVPVAEVDLHHIMKQWRLGRATRSIWDMLQDAYFALFTILLIGAMVTNLILTSQNQASGCTTTGCQASRTMLPVAMVFLLYAGTLSLGKLFGPVLVSAAEGSWLMDAPVGRKRLLTKRLWAAMGLGAGVSVLFTVLVSMLSGSSWLAVVSWALAAGIGSAALTAFAAREQAAERRRPLAIVQYVLTSLGLAALAAMVGVSATWWVLPAVDPDQVSLGFAVVAILALVALLVGALKTISNIRRTRLVSGGSLISGMQGAMFALDLGLIRDIVVDRKARERGSVKPVKGRGIGLDALIWRDLHRLLRFPGQVVVIALTLVVPYALVAMGLGVVAPSLSALVLVFALVPTMSTLRVMTRTRGLARAFPFSNLQLRKAGMTVPGVLALLWATLALPAFANVFDGFADVDWQQVGLVTAATGVAGWLGAVRWVSAKQVDFNSPMVATESGAMPPTLIFNLFRGFDMVVLITGPILFGFSPWIGLGIAFIAYFGLKGTFSQDELRLQEQASKRAMTAAGAKSTPSGQAAASEQSAMTAPKKIIKPPTRG